MAYIVVAQKGFDPTKKSIPVKNDLPSIDLDPCKEERDNIAKCSYLVHNNMNTGTCSNAWTEYIRCKIRNKF